MEKLQDKIFEQTMGNHLKVPKTSLYSVESDNAAPENLTEQQMNDDSAVQIDYRQFISTKVERQVEIRLKVGKD